jgi:protein phosphatase
MTIEMFGTSRKGFRRDENQDTWFADAEAQALGVYDGMGGHKGGALASNIAKRQNLAFLKGCPQRDLLAEMAVALSQADNAIFQATQGNLDLRDMGTTATFGLVSNSQLYLGHIGDSRAYLLSNGFLEQLTIDHTLGAALDSPPESNLHHMLWAALGKGFEDWERLISCHPLNAGDRLLFNTDGVSNVVSDEELQQILALAESPQEAVERVMCHVDEIFNDEDFSRQFRRVESHEDVLERLRDQLDLQGDKAVMERIGTALVNEGLRTQIANVSSVREAIELLMIRAKRVAGDDHTVVVGFITS